MIVADRVLDDIRSRGWSELNGCLDPAVVAEVLEQWRVFFSDADKAAVSSEGSLDGYFPLGAERAVGSPTADRKEFFQFHDPQIVPKNLRSPTKRLFSRACEIARAIAERLQAEQLLPFRPDYGRPGGHAMRIIRYEGGLGAAAYSHTDITLFTLGLAESVPGLWIEEPSGHVVAATVPAGGVVVVAGDMLEIASSGRIRACRHGVNTTGERQAVAFFANPSSEVRLREGLTAGDAVAHRLREMAA
jgi:isopenicillin N synthase-like dioxygenase